MISNFGPVYSEFARSSQPRFAAKGTLVSISDLQFKKIVESD